MQRAVRRLAGSAGMGLLVRLRPAVAVTRAQVPVYADFWAAANERALAADGPLWAALGDSAAQGIGASDPEHGYVGQLLRVIHERDGRAWRVVNLSRSGARVADVLAVQLPLLRALSAVPALVTCAVGANDLVRPGRAGGLEARVAALVAALPPGAVLATMPQGLGRRRALRVNALVRALGAARGLRIADVWAHTGPPWRGKLAADDFHPNERGYADWAAAFAEVIPGPARSSGAG